jgi:outer membrane assembly lipoprotein YfiO
MSNVMGNIRTLSSPQPAAIVNRDRGYEDPCVLLKDARTKYRRCEFAKALQAYQKLEQRYPGFSAIPYVIFQQAKCRLEQLPTVDRDQAMTRGALRDFQRLKVRFPDWCPTTVNKNIGACRQRLARFEEKIGDADLEKDNYPAALARFQRILRDYPEYAGRNEVREKENECIEKLQRKPKKGGLLWLISYPFAARL